MRQSVTRVRVSCLCCLLIISAEKWGSFRDLVWFAYTDCNWTQRNDESSSRDNN